MREFEPVLAAWKQLYGKLELVIELQVVNRAREVHQSLNQPSVAATDHDVSKKTLQDAGDQWLPITDGVLGICPRWGFLTRYRGIDIESSNTQTLDFGF